MTEDNNAEVQNKSERFYFSDEEVDNIASSLVPSNYIDIDKLEKSIKHSAQFLNDETSKQYGAVLLATPFQTFNFWVGTNEIFSMEKKRAISKILLGRPSTSSLKFDRLSEYQFEKASKLAYSETDSYLSKQDKELRVSTRKTRKWGAKKGLTEESRRQRISEEIENLERLTGSRLNISDLTSYHQIISDLEEGKISEDDLDPKEFLVFLLQDFILSGASDLHIVSHREGGRIRYRFNKKLYVRYDEIPFSIYNLIVNGLCTMAAKEPSLMKQRGLASVIKLTINDGKKVKPVEFRFQSNKSNHSPSVVLRGQSNPLTDLNKVGFFDKQTSDILDAIQQDNGIIIITGQTGSGKTNTLNCIFTILEDGDEIGIIEIGIPIEIESNRRMQITLFETADEEKNQLEREMQFANALRSDPDVIGYTEIRTKNETNIAIKAALTGHLVLTTLHAKDVEETYGRLFEMGIDRSLIAKGVICIVSQKLIRKLCSNCRIKDIDASQTMGCDIYIEDPRGCDEPKCEKGFAGATVVSEVLRVNEDIKSAILAGAKPAEISILAKEKKLMTSLQETALEKLKLGLTSQTEIDTLFSVNDPQPEEPFLNFDNNFDESLFDSLPIVEGELI